MPKRASTAEAIAEVAVGLPVHGTFHYRIPPHLIPSARIGVRVQVPFGRRKIVTGFVVGLPEKSDFDKLKDITEIEDPEPVFGAHQLEFYRFIAGYYFAPLGEVIRTALPAGLFKSTRPYLVITNEGRKALDNPLMGEVDRKILDILAGGEELSEKAIAKRLSSDVKGELLRLSRWKFIERCYRLGPLTAKRKLETVWRIREGLALDDAVEMLGRKTAKRIAVLEFLIKQGSWVGIKPINEVAPNARETLNKLVSAGLVEATDREVYRDIDCDVGCFAAADVDLHPEQQTAVEAVSEAMKAGAYQPFCLHGVTGSGKTEVYLRLAKQCLDAGKTAIVLVPEISLTPQFLGRFICRLGPVVAPYHSRLSDGERYDMWRKMQRGEAQVVVGARSALFAPFEQVGLVVVDEEHETSFKQEDGVAYHARDLALKLASMHRCPAVLGSATPSLETYAAAQSGRYRLLELTERPTGALMPSVDIVDMRHEMDARRKERRKKKKDDEPEESRKQTSERRVLSRPLAEALQATVEAGEQAILFLNRRGYASYSFCLECGNPLKCPLCDIALTYHEKANVLRCHYCDYQAPPPATCPHCAGVHLFFGGMGTERLEKEVAALLPEARLSRMDRDTIRGKGDLYRILSDFAQGQADVLVGTQMVAKGHDFPRVTLVGVIDADAALMLPDFRAAERAFQLISQVAGRAGRADRPGRVLVQTFQPDHYAIRAAADHDYRAFFSEENMRRAALNYPPHGRLAVLKITAPNAKAGLQACRDAKRAAVRAGEAGDVAGASILGPASSLLHRLHGKHHWHLLVKAEKAAGVHRLCGRVLLYLRESGNRQAVFRLDVDPVTVI